MSLGTRIAAPVSKVLARLHQWYATAWLLGRLPLRALDSTSLGRLRYALMMAHRTRARATDGLFEHLLQRNAGVAPELTMELAFMATVIDQPLKANRLLRTAIAGAAQGSHTVDAAGRLLAVNEGIANGSLGAGLLMAIDALALPGAVPVTLVPVSGKYLELWQLWLQQSRRHIGSHVVAMAMDDAAMTALVNEPEVAVIDLRAFFSWDENGHLHPQTRGVLWYLRVLVLQGLVRRNHAVLVLDLDAMPVGDLAPLLQELPAADVVVQKDHSIPVDVDRQLGFVLCCGFMFWRPTAEALAFLEQFALETAIERDDQLALNHLLARSGIAVLQEGENLRFRSKGALFACPSTAVVSRSLHTGRVVRHFHQEGQSVTVIRAALHL